MLTTSVDQLSELVRLGDDAVLRRDPLPLGVVLTACDVIARRQRAALSALGAGGLR